MSNAQRFCCVGCGKLLYRDEAKQVFRTGFFRGTIPLGYCKLCSEIAAERAREMPGVSAADPGSDEDISFQLQPQKPSYLANRPLIYSA